MRVTNKLSLPETILRAAENDGYSKDGADFTSTQLSNPPRAEALKFLFPDKMERDVSSMLPSILGQAIHAVLERGARPGIDIIEKRYFADIAGVKLGGKIDLYDPETKTLYEYKSCLTKAFSKKNGGGGKPEWIAQASVNKYLMNLNLVEVNKVVIAGFLVDWRPWMAEEVSVPIPRLEIETWSEEKTKTYIESRIKLHLAARELLPHCSSKETWGGSMCKNYCEVNKICTQYQHALKTGILESE